MRPRATACAFAAAAFLAACSDTPLPFETDGIASGADVVSLQLDRNSISASVGDTVRLHGRAIDVRGRLVDRAAISWRVADPSVAAVEDGLVIPLAPGTTEIIAVSQGVQASALLSSAWSTTTLQALTLSPASVTLEPAKTEQLTAIILYSNGMAVQIRTTAKWISLNPSVAKVTNGKVTAVANGTAKIIARLMDLADTVTVVVATSAAPPVDAPPANPPAPTTSNVELPREYVDVTMPAVTGRSIRVGPDDDLQNAIDEAQLGDEIVLEAGETYKGPTLRLRKKSGSGWLTIRTDALSSLPAAGTRVTPEHARFMPKLVAYLSPERVIETDLGAHHYRLIGLEVTAIAGERVGYTLVDLGSGNGTRQNTHEQQPHHLVLDRMYIHGTPTLNFQRCIGLNSAYTAIVDSWISECHGKGMDSQAIGGWNGTGPYKIVNNHLAGAGENVMFGGADPAIPNGLPSDMEIRRNHFYKPPAWKGVWSVKNLFELKIGRRVLVEGNIFENCWLDAQTGFALNFKSTNQSGRAPWSETSDVTFRYNVIRNTDNGVSISSNPGSHPAVPASRFLFAHNVFDGIGTDGYPGGRLFQLSGIQDLTLEHNTTVSSHSGMILQGGRQMTGLRVVNNIFAGTRYGITGDGVGGGTAALNARSGPDGWTFTGNVLSGLSASQYPTGNFFPNTVADIGFAGLTTGNFALIGSSPYWGVLAGGVSPGADQAEVTRATQGVSGL